MFCINYVSIFFSMLFIIFFTHILMRELNGILFKMGMKDAAQGIDVQYRAFYYTTAYELVTLIKSHTRQGGDNNCIRIKFFNHWGIPCKEFNVWLGNKEVSDLLIDDINTGEFSKVVHVKQGKCIHLPMDTKVK